MPETDINEAFLFVTPVLGVSFYCFTNGTPCFLRVHFLNPFGGSPYLVLLGARPTVLGHNLEKYERSEKSSGRPPTVEITTLLIAYCQLRTPKSKTILKFQLSSLQNSEIFWTWKNSQEPQISSILEDSSDSSEEKPTIQRLSEKPFSCQGVSTRMVNSISLRI